MCDPISIGLGAITVMGQLKAGQDANSQAQAQAGQYEQQARENNLQADEMQYQSKVVQDDALARAMIIRKQGVRDTASSDVAQAASGVVVGEGSGGEVDRTIANNTEMDAHMSILSGTRQARQLNLEADATRRGAANNLQSASYARQAGANAETNSLFSAAGTVLGGVQSYNRYQGWKTNMQRSGATQGGN